MKLLKTAFLAFIFSNLVFAQQENIKFNEVQKTAVIEKALVLIKENYVFPEKFDQMEKVINKKLANKEYEKFNSPQEFLNQLNRDLQTSGKDRHLKISFSPQMVKQIIEDRNKKDDIRAELSPELLGWIRFENYGMRKVERMEGNIGYFKFDRFTDLYLAKETIVGSMNFLSNASAIILDLRDNGGGDGDASNFIINYFFPDNTKIGEIKFRKDEQAKDVIVKKDKDVKKISNDVPVYILVSNKTASAAENVTYVLQQFKRAVVIGEQTSGKANPGELFVINDFLYMMLPTGAGKIEPSGTNWEGTGVIPDIKIDPIYALPKAITEICSILEKKDSNEGHKLIYRWISAQFNAQLNPEFPSQEFISSIIGDYDEGRKIIFENAIVYYVGSSGTKRKLSYMGNQTFMIEGRDDYRMKFQVDQKSVNHYDVLWYDGTSEKVYRAR
jgi:hypothetical protein